VKAVAMPKLVASDSEIVSRAIKEIKPKPSHEGLCRSQVAEIIKTLKHVRAAKFITQPVKAQRRRFSSLASALHKAANMLQKKFSDPMSLALLFDGALSQGGSTAISSLLKRLEKTCDELEVIAVAAEQCAKTFRSNKDARQPDNFKLKVALRARGLLERFGGKRPTLSGKGAFYNLTRVLYEGATGVEEANLERACRRVAVLGTKLPRTVSD
jgi:hypothetical protein